MEVFDEQFAKEVAYICFEKFEKLPKSGKPICNREWVSLAAIVKYEANNKMLISLATGSKCIGKSKLSAQGDIINDSHAEVS